MIVGTQSVLRDDWIECPSRIGCCAANQRVSLPCALKGAVIGIASLEREPMAEHFREASLKSIELVVCIVSEAGQLRRETQKWSTQIYVRDQGGGPCDGRILQKRWIRRERVGILVNSARADVAELHHPGGEQSVLRVQAPLVRQRHRK